MCWPLMGGSEKTEVLRTYTIQSNTLSDHGVPSKVVGEAAKIAAAVGTRDTQLLWHQKRLGGVVEAAVCRKRC